MRACVSVLLAHSTAPHSTAQQQPPLSHRASVALLRAVTVPTRAHALLNHMHACVCVVIWCDVQTVTTAARNAVHAVSEGLSAAANGAVSGAATLADNATHALQVCGDDLLHAAAVLMVCTFSSAFVEHHIHRLTHKFSDTHTHIFRHARTSQTRTHPCIQHYTHAGCW